MAPFTFNNAPSLFPCLLLVLLSSSLYVASDSVKEANALLKWAATLHNVKNSNISSWPPPSQNTSPPCNWLGISCNPEGRVVRLNLTNAGLEGTLNNLSFSSFPDLSYIDLSNNELSGTVPLGLTRLSKLIYLDLSHNPLHGTIPPEIGLLTNLETLFLGFNDFTGSIPSPVGNLSSLTELALYANSLEGPIPASLFNLTKMVNLYLYGNKNLSGPIPQEIGNMKSLRTLDLRGNNFSGQIPLGLTRLSKLVYLDLSYNRLQGTIPPEIGLLTNLDTLHLVANLFAGSIPSTFGNLRKVGDLGLCDNNLSGTIPEEIATLPNLSALHLDNNQFTGNLSQSFCRNKMLQNFTVSNNYLQGPIPRSFRDCKSFMRVSLAGNQFAGNLSEVFGVYPHLYFLDISQNNFYGEISPNWGKFPQLATLWMADNYISGSIPPEIGNAATLLGLDLSSNQLSGRIPVELGKLTSLVKLNLANNQLSDFIPPELELLTNLELLDLSSNQLRAIPPKIGNLVKLNYLNLSNNEFSQKIPHSLGKLFHLSQLDLGRNFLSGDIPPDLSGLESLEVLNISYNNLSGFIPESFNQMLGLVTVNISYNQLEGPIPQLKAFRYATILEFQGNKGLCGHVEGLPPCNSSSTNVYTSKTNKTKFFLGIFSPVCGVLLLLWSLGIYFCLSKIKVGIYICLSKIKVGIYFCLSKLKADSETDEEEDESYLISRSEGRAMYDEIVKCTDNFDSANCIGKGAFGAVYRGILPSGSMVAVKKLDPLVDAGRRYQKEFLNEIKALTQIRHSNITKLYGFCCHSKQPVLVYEYIKGHSLAAALDNNESARELDWSRRVNIVKGVAHALSYMHNNCSPPIVHRDISSKSILLDSDFEACVSGFGTAKLLYLDSSHWTAMAGWYGYTAPEQFDIYNFGVLALEVIQGKYPGEIIFAMSPSSVNNIQLEDVMDERLPTPSPEIRQELMSILKISTACLCSNPQSHPTMRMASQILDPKISLL